MNRRRFKNPTTDHCHSAFKPTRSRPPQASSDPASMSVVDDSVQLFSRKSMMEPKPKDAFNAQAFLKSPGIGREIVAYRRGEVIFTQGDACETVLYIQAGGVKLSVLSKTGREAITAMLVPGDFFGEGCLAGQPVRLGSATALTSSTILSVEK